MRPGQVADIRAWAVAVHDKLREVAQNWRRASVQRGCRGRNHIGSPFLRYVAQVIEVVVDRHHGRLKADLNMFCLLGVCSTLLP